MDRSMSTTSGRSCLGSFARGHAATRLARDLDVGHHAQRRREGLAEGRVVVDDEDSQARVSFVQFGGVAHADPLDRARRRSGKVADILASAASARYNWPYGGHRMARMGDARHRPDAADPLGRPVPDLRLILSPPTSEQHRVKGIPERTRGSRGRERTPNALRGLSRGHGYTSLQRAPRPDTGCGARGTSGVGRGPLIPEDRNMRVMARRTLTCSNASRTERDGSSSSPKKRRGCSTTTTSAPSTSCSG